MKRLAIPAALLITAVIVSGFFWPSSTATDTKYFTAPVEKGNIVRFVTSTGSVKPVGEVNVGSPISGQIEELLVDFNDHVGKGQVLARLDDEVLAARLRGARAAVDVANADVAIRKSVILKAQSELELAKAQSFILEANANSAQAIYDEAERNLERKKNLLASNTISESIRDQARADQEKSQADLQAKRLQSKAHQSSILSAEAALAIARAEYDNAKAIVRQQQAQLDQAVIEIDRMTIRSPIDGVVIGRDVERGQTVAATLEAPTLFTLAHDLRKMEVHAKIDEADIGNVRNGQKALFTVDTYPDQSFAGTVTQIRKSPETVQNVVTYTVVISANNDEQKLMPGMTAFIRLVVANFEDVLKLPNAALRFRPETQSAMPPTPTPSGDDDTAAGTQAVVWVIREAGDVSPVAIRIGAASADATQIISGSLDVDQRVLVGSTPATRSKWTFFGLPLGD